MSSVAPSFMTIPTIFLAKMCKALLASIALLTLSLTPGPAKSQAVAPNGCGTGWSAHVVPDYFPIAACEFKKSCDAHDMCYGACEASPPTVDKTLCEYRRCENGGNLYGSKECRDDPKFKFLFSLRDERRAACDSTFYDDIRSANSGKPICGVFALIYKVAVRLWGNDAFVGVDGTIVSMTDAEKIQSEAAFKEFLAKGTEADFKLFLGQVARDAASFDPLRPFVYDPKHRKLINTR